jgi:hypothetical protein
MRRIDAGQVALNRYSDHVGTICSEAATTRPTAAIEASLQFPTGLLILRKET